MATEPYDTALLDGLISRLLNFQYEEENPIGLSEEQLFYVIERVAQMMYRRPGLLECDAPVTICGDTHGQYKDVISLFEHCGWPPTMRYLFLGDYVDRGKYSIETVTLMFLFKLRYPGTFFVLRGNHETASINRVYGFYDECKRRYGSIRLWNHFQLAFDSLPVASLVSGRIFCMHGGLSPDLRSFNQLRNMLLPFKCPDEGGMLADLLWSDPCKTVQGYQPSSRGVSYIFGENVVTEFVEHHNIDLICRAHQVVNDGYEFFAGKRLITIFSAPNYCGEFKNCAGMLYVNKGLHCKIRQLKPDTKNSSHRSRRK